jgi:hypothetical protein
VCKQLEIAIFFHRFFMCSSLAADFVTIGGAMDQAKSSSDVPGIATLRKSHWSHLMASGLCAQK